MSRFVALSSTTSTRSPRSTVGAGTGASTTLVCFGSRSRTRNVLPCPGVLSTAIVPPISTTSCRQIVRPSPVPPWRRVELPSTCVKLSKMASRRSAAMPIPVSHTASSMPSSASVSSVMRATIVTSPRSVNLIAFPTRFVSTCLSRLGSPCTAPGNVGGMTAASSMPFSFAFGANRSATSSTMTRTSMSTRSTVILPASIFEKSRMSLMTVSSESLQRRIVSAYSRCSSVSVVSSMMSVMPITPFIGVRISWLMFARNSDFARVEASASSRARASSST